MNFYLWENIWNILFLTLKTELANREFFSVMAHRRKNSHPLCKQKRISAVLDLLSAKTRQEVGLVTLLYHTQRFYIENTEKESYKYKMEWSRKYRSFISVESCWDGRELDARVAPQGVGATGLGEYLHPLHCKHSPQERERERKGIHDLSINFRVIFLSLLIVLWLSWPNPPTITP